MVEILLGVAIVALVVSLIALGRMASSLMSEQRKVAQLERQIERLNFEKNELAEQLNSADVTKPTSDIEKLAEASKSFNPLALSKTAADIAWRETQGALNLFGSVPDVSQGRITETERKKIVDLLKQGKKINAIKAYQLASNVSLKDANTFVNELTKQLKL